MRNDQHLAIKLRKKGISYSKISKELGIPKSTLCCWFRDLDWSKEIKEKLNERNIRKSRKRMRIISKVNKLRWKKWRESYQKEAKKEYNYFRKNSLFISGLNLYWGEGDNKLENGIVRLSNTDPRMIRIFCNFLSAIRVPKNKIRVSLILYPDLLDNKCKIFWSKASKIPLCQFYKTQFIKGRHPTKRLEHGICIIQMNSRGLKEKIFVWTELFYQEYKK